MPFTHVDTERRSPQTPTKRKHDFSETRRSPPALRQLTTSTSESSPIVSRLKPNPYAADQMASIPPPPQRTSPPSASTPPTSRSSNNAATSSASNNNNNGSIQETLPSIRDMIPELPAIGSLPPPSTSSQDCGPESFRPTGPNLRPAASGLAPSPLTAARIQPYPTPDATPNTGPFQERKYSNPAPTPSSISSTTRNSPLQPFTGAIPHRPESLRNLPPLGSASGFGSPESSRAGGYPQSGSSLAQHAPAPPPPLHWQSSSYHPPSSSIPSPAYGPPHGMHMAPTASPSYSHFDNSDYGSDGKSKRRRGNLPKQVTDTLRKWFNEHISHPYPTEDEKMMLMNATNLTMSQISNWFINARRRSLPQHGNRDAADDVRNAMPMGYMSDRV